MSRRGGSERNKSSSLLIPYIATVVLLAIGGLALVTQRAKITRLGFETARLRAETSRAAKSISRRRLQVARLKSTAKLIENAKRFGLDHIVPPEQALTDENSEGTAGQ